MTGRTKEWSNKEIKKTAQPHDILNPPVALLVPHLIVAPDRKGEKNGGKERDNGHWSYGWIAEHPNE